MIYSIVGRPRSGKSYESVVFHIIPAIKSGRKVITNVTLNISYFQKVFGNDVLKLIKVVDGQLTEYGSMSRPFSKYEDYTDDWRDEQNRGPLYVVDEAHMVLPNKQLDSKILEFYSLHGHYGIDIILLTQNLRKVHRDIKDMIEMTYYCAKNTAFGSDKTYTKKVRIGATTEAVNEEQRKYKKEFFPFYQSHTQSNGSVAEAMANDIKPIWHKWPFWGSALLITLAIVFNIYAWSGDDESPVPDKEIPAQTYVQVPDGAPGTEPEKKQKTSGKFGPLNSFEMFVTGYAKQIAYVSRTKTSGEINRDLTFYHIYIDVYDGDEKMFSLNQTDLQDMGYVFQVLADCVYQVSWDGVSRVMTCYDNKEQHREDSPIDTIMPISI
ncbi:zonular occludens toxin domain-containing protein [Vibrio scophthalmi]|uniref:zonular occludens toxin domain-containing protein n=1 Tax=Vibrio scophthalmi TaxID=45658 RepID=UPI003EBFF7BE